ncbi:uncharacterized protein LOC122505927 [Leptopilina heterotoma]|uniref:uncharacterized protein LOC122505926 n=1 Tax=Leptopilina heterotoma TaxID=63436 RepID=UPI001CA7D5B1|nr:uncharacterized protein LOC122505926 [Leptopilina heterotoma]XP_043473747.1 uncharacterized protein LOC122505927 [Leptopilina heterotoma]
MIWRQEYFWRKSTGEYLHRGFWATSSFRDPAMLKSEDGHMKIMVGGEVNCVEEEEIFLQDLLARYPPRFGAYAVREEYFISFIEEFLPINGEMTCFRFRWQLVRMNKTNF